MFGSEEIRRRGRALQEPLSLLIRAVAERARTDVLASTIVFPRTASLEADKPVCVITVEETEELDFIAIADKIQTDPELIALGAREDVAQVLHVLNKMKDELHLQQFDSIQIYRGGVDLLRIVNKKRNIGRSAFVELNEYRRRLYNYAHPSSSISTRSLLTHGVVMFVAVVLGNWVTKNCTISFS